MSMIGQGGIRRWTETCRVCGGSYTLCNLNVRWIRPDGRIWRRFVDAASSHKQSTTVQEIACARRNNISIQEVLFEDKKPQKPKNQHAGRPE